MAISDLSGVMYDGYTESFTRTGGVIHEQRTVDWALREATKDALLGYAHSDYTTFVGTAVSLKPLNPGSTTPSKAVLTITYTDEESAAETGGSTSSDWDDWKVRWESAAEAMTIGKGYKWADTTASVKPEDASMSMLIPSMVLTVTGTTTASHSDIIDRTDSAVGKVNKDAVVIHGVSIPADCGLFLGCDLDEGSGYTTATLKFNVRWIATWNQFWRNKDDLGGGPGWQSLLTEDGENVYSDVAFASTVDPKNWGT